MALDQATNLELQKILGFEVSSLNTKSTSSPLSDKLDPDLVMSAEGKAWDGELRISQTSSFSAANYSSRLKDDSQPQTGPSLVLSDPNIPKSTYVSYSKVTTGQPSYTESVIQAGAIESALSSQSGKQSPKSGQKAETYDSGKAPLAHLPWAAVEALSRVQQYGHLKYKDFNNYRKGMEVTRNLSCALRHIKEYLEGKDLDEESKESSLAHAMCRIAFVLQNLHDGTAIDDRYKS